MKIRDKVQELLDSGDYSYRYMASLMGIGTTAFHQWHNGKYQGDNSRIERAVESLIVRIKEKKLASKFKTEFVETSVSKSIFEVARTCHIDGELGVVTGQAGLGKTRAIKEYQIQNPDVIVIEADNGFSPRVVFKMIHKYLGLGGRGIYSQFFEESLDKLAGSERLVIVDEAENLPYATLESLRRLYDKSGIGLLLVGMPRLIQNLRGRRAEYLQLYSRVGVYYSLDHISSEDAKELIEKSFPQGAALADEFYKKAQGNTRRLEKLLKRAMKICEVNEVKVSKKIIQEAADTLII